VWVVWDLLHDRAYVELPQCGSAEEAAAELVALLRPYPARDAWRRRLSVRRVEAQAPRCGKRDRQRVGRPVKRGT
jgi:hypothetical protein